MLIDNKQIDLHELTNSICVKYYCLRNIISSLPDSSVKNRLLSHMTTTIEFKSISDFWSLYSKVMMVMDIALQEKLDEELLNLSIEIRKILCMVLAYILQAEDNGCSEDIELNCLF